MGKRYERRVKDEVSWREGRLGKGCVEEGAFWETTLIYEDARNSNCQVYIPTNILEIMSLPLYIRKAQNQNMASPGLFVGS
jgi:hypothetical protein